MILLMTSIANLRRIHNEIKDLNLKKTEYENMFRIEMVDDDMYHWLATVYGPVDSLYENYEFQIDIALPDTYPSAPPRVKFLTPIQHVNVNSNGDICLDTLKQSWGSSQSMASVMVTIVLLLSEPNPDDALNTDLGQLYRKDKDRYAKKITDSCEKNCKKRPGTVAKITNTATNMIDTTSNMTNTTDTKKLAAKKSAVKKSAVKKSAPVKKIIESDDDSDDDDSDDDESEKSPYRVIRSKNSSKAGRK